MLICVRAPGPLAEMLWPDGAAQLASIRQMSRQVSRGSAGEYQSDERAGVAHKLLQSCPTLCDPIDGSPPDSPVTGILQASTLEWVAISFSTKTLQKNFLYSFLFACPTTQSNSICLLSLSFTHLHVCKSSGHISELILFDSS